jgi:hypothetical protein
MCSFDAHFGEARSFRMKLVIGRLRAQQESRFPAAKGDALSAQPNPT